MGPPALLADRGAVRGEGGIEEGIEEGTEEDGLSLMDSLVEFAKVLLLDVAEGKDTGEGGALLNVHRGQLLKVPSGLAKAGLRAFKNSV